LIKNQFYAGKGVKMEDLIDAVKSGNESESELLACDYFITNDGRCNWANMNKFEELLPGAKIVCLEKDSFGWLIGGIKYNGKTISYG
jgi:hypothetical protein